MASLIPRGRNGSLRNRPTILPETDGRAALTTNHLGMKLVLIPSGEYLMGFSPGSDFVDRDERAHHVRLSRPFYLSVHEVTVGQFRQFVNATGYRTEGEQGNGQNHGFTGTGMQFDLGPHTWRDPGFPQDEDSPVVLVSWNDATEFCRWLSNKENQSYRLPTEAEWEWACRAGTSTRFSTGDADDTLREVANIYKVQPKPQAQGVVWGEGYLFTTPVGAFRANRFGLYDMHG
ncbi:MAG: formylglycine-generating enzyme family protein, partial [Thermoguttaceae bacterium]